MSEKPPINRGRTTKDNKILHKGNASESSVEVIVNPEVIEEKLKLIDRLVNWEVSLTSREKFKELLLNGKQLRVKFGVDITAKTLHIGHAVNLRAMSHLQDLGHKVIFLLGGFTTLVGDPTDKLITRSSQSGDDIEQNKKAFIEQIKKIVHFDNSNLIEIRDNTEWWGTRESHGSINIGNLFEMLKSTTVRSMLSRDMFRKRTDNDTPIYLSEFLYPILQGYDSVEIESDLTIVGSDQLFNEKMSWEFQEKAHQDKQAILCTKITPGLDGGEKQSKSIGNYVGLSHSPKEKFNKVMLLLDELIPQWFEVYTEIDQKQIDSLKSEYSNDPVAFKRRLAFYITELFHGTNEAEKADADFENKKFLKRIPSEIPEVPIGKLDTLDSLLRIYFRQKTGEIRDLTKNNALAVISKINDDGTFEEELVSDINHARNIKLNGGEIIRRGKNKFFKLI